MIIASDVAQQIHQWLQQRTSAPGEGERRASLHAAFQKAPHLLAASQIEEGLAKAVGLGLVEVSEDFITLK